MINRIDMIITDLDNSLLNNEGQISEYTKNIFVKCKDKGIIIVFATARPYKKTLTFFNSIEPDAVIFHCGCGVYAKEKIICQNVINSDIAQNIIKNIIKDFPKINIGADYKDDLYTNFNTEIYWEGVTYKKIDIKNLPPKNVYKIVIGLESIKNLDVIEKYLSNELYIEKTGEKVGFIMNKNATKWNGIKELLKYYGIKKNAISFGDDDPDIEMIEKCGIGIAVENGNRRIKDKAKYVCKNNNEDGIAKWIEDKILKEEQTCT
jgi:Cof subfamily protein (haloacid dehalogenase superfamily)